MEPPYLRREMTVRRTKDTIIKIKNCKFSLLSALSYLFDWLIYIAVLVFALCYQKRPPRYHEFALDDNSLSFTYYDDENVAVSPQLLLIISIVLPLVQIITNFAFTCHCISRRLWNLHMALLGFFAAHVLQCSVVSVLNINCGLPRPDLIQRCMPSDYSLAPIGMLSNVAICSNPDITIINDGFKSFPSSYAAISFTSATFASLIVAAKFKVFDKRGILFKLLIFVLPYATALYLSTTQISDNRYSLLDSIFGTLIGIACGLIGYHIYFPWFLETNCKGMAFPPRRLCHKSGKFWRISHDDSFEYDDDAMFIDDETTGEETSDTSLEPPRSIRSKKSRPSSSRFRV